MHSPQVLKKDAEYILNKLKKIRPDIIFRVVILKGTGKNPRYKEDLEILSGVINELKKTSNT